MDEITSDPNLMDRLIPTDCPLPWQYIIRSCCHADPTKRPTPSQVRHLLQYFIVDLTGVTPSGQHEGALTSRWTRNRPQFTCATKLKIGNPKPLATSGSGRKFLRVGDANNPVDEEIEIGPHVSTIYPHHFQLSIAPQLYDNVLDQLFPEALRSNWQTALLL